MNYTLYTDGAYSRKHDEGAFAFILLNENGNEVKRFAKKINGETNNRAELKAIMAGVFCLPADATAAHVCSDSEYALKTLFENWSRGKNTDLFDIWENQILPNKKNVRFTHQWVRGHNGDCYNELCDKMCSDVLGYDCNKEFEKYKQNVMMPGFPIFKD